MPSGNSDSGGGRVTKLRKSLPGSVEELEVLRDELVDRIPKASQQYLPSLTRMMLEVGDRIRELKALEARRVDESGGVVGDESFDPSVV